MATIAHKQFGVVFQIHFDVEKRDLADSGIFHRSAVPIDDVDGGALTAQVQKAKRRRDGKLPGVAIEGSVEEPADQG